MITLKLNRKNITAKILTHRSMIKVNDTYGTVGTVRGYAAQYGEHPERAFRKQKSRRKELNRRFQDDPSVWANVETVTLCSDPGFYTERDRERRGAINLEENGYVLIEGDLYQVQFIGPHYSDFVHFNQIKQNIK